MAVRGRPAPRGARRKVAATKRAAITTKKPPPKTAARVSRNQNTYDTSKVPTDYHKQFARWIMKECGFNPEEMKSKTYAFLYGVSIATASRPIFMKSDFLADWREETGQAKRGPKSSAQKPIRRGSTKVADDDEFDETDDDDEFEDDVEDDDDEFDDESEDESEEDDDEFDDESEDDDDEFEDDEEEPEPPKRGRSAASRKAATTRGASGQRRTSAPSKKPATRGKAKAAVDDDDFVF